MDCVIRLAAANDLPEVVALLAELAPDDREREDESMPLAESVRSKGFGA
jgi:hypothetical protein